MKIIQEDMTVAYKVDKDMVKVRVKGKGTDIRPRLRGIKG